MKYEAMNEILASQYRAALRMLRVAIEQTPLDHWSSTEFKNPIWQIAYHALWSVKYYLGSGPESYEPWVGAIEGAEYLTDPEKHHGENPGGSDPFLNVVLPASPAVEKPRKPDEPPHRPSDEPSQRPADETLPGASGDPSPIASGESSPGNPRGSRFDLHHTKNELLAFIKDLEMNLDHAISSLPLDGESGFDWYPVTRFELHLNTIRYLQHYTGLIYGRLRERGVIGFTWEIEGR